jgi:Na+-driven multidrug efflux pump
MIQIDLSMIAGIGSGALAAYGLLMRITIIDAAMTAAIGSISLIYVSNVSKQHINRSLLYDIWLCAGLLGGAAAVIGIITYPILVDLLAGKSPAWIFANSSIYVVIATAPLHMFISSTNFMLHALDKGGVVLTWQIIEVCLKVIFNILLIPIYGFEGSYISTLCISLVTIPWAILVTHFIVSPGDENQPNGFKRRFITNCLIESTRGLGPQLAIFISFSIFAFNSSSILGQERLDAYAAVQCMIALVLAPLIATTRFFAMRFADYTKKELRIIIIHLLRSGLPILIVMSILLVVIREPLGNMLYGSLGVWWSCFAAILALSIPLRYVGAILRATLLSRARVSVVAVADGVSPWIISLPLIFIGVFSNRPLVASLSMIAAEVASVTWFWYNINSKNWKIGSLINDHTYE